MAEQYTDRKVQLVINKLSRVRYDQLQHDQQIQQDQLYIISDDLPISAQISNMLSDYYKKTETSSAIEIDSKFNTLSTYVQTKSQLSNDGYLTAHQSLDDYYKKFETSSDTELNLKFAQKADEYKYGISGTSRLLNETDGGGAMFVGNDGINSYVGVHDGTQPDDGVRGQLYVVNSKIGGAQVKIDMFEGRFCYLTGEAAQSNLSDQEYEIATYRVISSVSSILNDSIQSEAERAAEAEKALQSDIALSVSGLSNELKPLIDAAQAAADSKTTDTIGDENGRLRIFNERLGGGAKIEDDKNRIWSFVGVNQPNLSTGSYGSLYVLDSSNPKSGARLKMFKEGFNYKTDSENWNEFSANYELAVQKDISDTSAAIEQTISDLSVQLTSDINHKVFIEDPSSEQYADGKYSDLSVIKITEDEYEQKVLSSQLSDGVLYVVSADHINVYGQKIVNLADPSDLSDAVNRHYVDEKTTAIESKLNAIKTSFDAIFNEYSTSETQDSITMKMLNAIREALN